MWKIYEIKTEDGRVYFGCTSLTMNSRMSVHKYQKKEFVIQPYTLRILFETESKEDALLYESDLINKYDSSDLSKGYNRRLGGSQYGFPDYVKMSRDVSGLKNPMHGKTHSEKTKEKIRKRALARDPSTFDKNRIKTPDQLEKLHKGRDKYFLTHNSYMKGKTHSDETKTKISLSAKGNKRWLGKKHSEETKRKISETKRRNKLLNP